MPPLAHALLHSGRHHRAYSTHRRSALPDGANNEVVKVKAAKYFSKFDYCHGHAWAKTLSMHVSLSTFNFQCTFHCTLHMMPHDSGELWSL
jgi:hypothetical protein